MKTLKTNCIEYTVSNLPPLTVKPIQDDPYYSAQYKSENWTHTVGNIYQIFYNSKNGITIMPQIYKDNIKDINNYIGQHFIYLDFDDNNHIDKILQIGENNGLIPNFYYETLSYKENDLRYRLSFFLDEFITNPDLVKYYFFIFKKIFEGVIDQQAANPFQTMLGGNGNGKVLNMHHRLSFNELNMNFKQYLKMNDTDRNFSRTLERIAKKIPNLEQYMSIENYCESIKSDNYDEILEKYRTQNGGDHLLNHDFLQSASVLELKDFNMKPHTFMHEWGNKGCELISKANAGEIKLNHFQRCGFSGPVIKYVKGGRSIIKNWLTELNKINMCSYENISKHSQDSSKMFTPGCEVMSCPFIDTCKNRGKTPWSIINPEKKRYIQSKENIETQSIKESEMKLHKTFVEALNQPVGTITIPKWETAIGKSELLLSLFLENNDLSENFTIAVPRYNLMDEFVDRIKDKVIKNKYSDFRDYIQKPQIPTLNNMEVNELINIDRINGGNGIEILKEYIFTQSISNQYFKKSEEYKKIVDYIQRKIEFKLKNNKITTHADVFLNKDDDNKILIFDEDPLNSIFAKADIQIDTIKELIKFANIDDMAPDTVKVFLNEIINLNKNTIIELNTLNKPSEKDWKEFIFFAKISKKLTNENIFNLINFDFIKLTDKYITIGKVNKLPKNKTIIILSATANEWIYKTMFPECNFITTNPVEPIGQIIQNKKLTFSDSSFKGLLGIDVTKKELLSCLNKNIKVEDYKKSKKEKLIEYFKEEFTKNNIQGVITLKKYTSIFSDMGYETMYFGNLDGLNSFKNKTIAIVGTPFASPEQVNFLHYCLFKKVSDIQTTKKIEITRNGYTFSIKTYEDEAMQNIHLSILDSHMVQAVGRSRLIRSNEDCKVFIYGAYPVPFSKIIP